ncbi:MAG: DNA topoisomerase I subunit omega, partial [Acidobacteria bacterium]|nr:DNA topoisomerase I subunit omega [Acidobacteriota bacterium]
MPGRRSFSLAAVMPDLVIVESPGKTRKINQILGSGYVVRASLGHVRDLPQPQRNGSSRGQRRQTALGLDIPGGWKPDWEIIDSKAKVVRELRGLGRDGVVWLATDLDREGEAIAWHLRDLLGGSEDRFRRVTFSEITPTAVQAAFQSPRRIDYDLVRAQQARRFLDRVVGFTVSPLLSRRLNAGLSAGRVQSAALAILAARDEKIRVFRPAEFFGVDVLLAVEGHEPVQASVVDVDGGVVRFADRGEADALAAHLASVAVTLDDVAEKDASQRPKPPFTTSTLQQVASSRLKLSVSDTMAIAQKLYEAGKITYMRSDAVMVAPEAREAARNYLAAAFGAGVVPAEPPRYESKEGSQEAHEAIRPTNPAAGPEGIEPEHAPLYDLI